jgi:hypothetical protein
MIKTLTLLIIILSTNTCFSKEKWFIGLAIEKNYNSRIKRPTPGGQSDSKLLTFIDTVDNPCLTNSVRFSFERKIWRFIAIKTGFRYGRKGDASCRDLDFIYNANTGLYKSQPYYFHIPNKSFSIPLMISLNKYFLNNKLCFTFSFGFERKYGKLRENNVNSSNPTNLSKIKSGFWGFKPQKEMSENTPLYFGLSEGVDLLQYIFEFQIKYKIMDHLYCNVNFDYMTDRKFRTKPYYLFYGYYTHDIKFYTASLGLGFSYSF